MAMASSSRDGASAGAPGRYAANDAAKHLKQDGADGDEEAAVAAAEEVQTAAPK